MDFDGFKSSLKQNRASQKVKKSNKKINKPSIEALKATIEKKRECNTKALEIVIQLSEDTVSESCLVEKLNLLSQEHYQDIVEERAISKCCGYPLCRNEIKSVPSKQYHISTTHNKVFDITDRKNFCSNLCYKASKYLKDQISTTPLWLREDQPSTSYSFISLQSKGGIAGDEVDLGFTSLKLEDNTYIPSINTTDLSNTDEISISSVQSDKADQPTASRPINKEDELLTSGISCYFNKSLNNSNSHSENELEAVREIALENQPQIDEPSCKEKTIPANNSNLLDKNIDIQKCNISSALQQTNTEELNKEISENSKSIAEAIVKKEINQSNAVDDNVSSQKCSKSHKHSSSRAKTHSTHKQQTPEQSIVLKIEKILKQWISIDSLCFILGEEKMKEILADKSNYITEFSTAGKKDIHFYERYLAICKKLNIMELEDTKMDQSFKTEDKKPLPDYEALKEEAKNLELKVNMFFRGDKVVQFEEPDVSKSENEQSCREPVLPLVDLHAQRALRRRIVIDKLRKVLQDLQTTLGLKCFNLSEELRTLVSTFTLSSHNITMRPAEWNLITIVMIKLLSVKDKRLEEVLKSQLTSKHLTLLLMSYSLDSGYLDRLIVWLTDVESVLQLNE